MRMVYENVGGMDDLPLYLKVGVTPNWSAYKVLVDGVEHPYLQEANAMECWAIEVIVEPPFKEGDKADFLTPRRIVQDPVTHEPMTQVLNGLIQIVPQ